METNNTLEDVKVGDSLYIARSNRWYGNIEYTFYRVTKITPTMVVCGSYKIRKNNGSIIGDDRGEKAAPLTPEVFAEYKARQARRDLENTFKTAIARVALSTVPAEVLQQIIDIIKEIKTT